MSRRRTRQDKRSTNQDNCPKKSPRKRNPQHRIQSHKVVVPTVAFTIALTGPAVLAAEKEVLTAPEVEVQEQRPGYVVPNLGLSRLPQPLRDIPQSITVVPQELIQEQGASSLRDALRNVTGISFQAGEGGGAQGDNLTIRGFNARNDFFLDGVRDQGSYFRDVFNTEAIEVLKGPSALYFGRGTTGGIINQVSKLPRLESFYGGTLSLGNGFLFRTTGDINQRINETTAFRMNFMGHLDEVVDRDEVEQKRMGIAPSVTFGLGTPTQLLEIGTEDFNATRFAFSNIPTTSLLNPNPVRDTSRMAKYRSS